MTASTIRTIARQSGLSRRHFLRGLGACVALPALRVAWRPAPLLAAGPRRPAALATTATGAPLRAAFVYFPNGAIPAAWWPSGEGTDFHVQAAPSSRWSRSRS